MALDLRPFKRVIQNGGQVHRGGPLVDGVLPHLQQVGAAHQLVHGTHPQAGHVLPQLLGHEAHEIHHILRFSGEAPPQLRVLGGDPCRAGAQVAYPHHAAAHGDQGAVAKPNSSAPSMQAMATSRPLISLPSVSTMTRERRPFMIRVCGSRPPQAPKAHRQNGWNCGGQHRCPRHSRRSVLPEPRPWPRRRQWCQLPARRTASQRCGLAGWHSSVVDQLG